MKLIKQIPMFVVKSKYDCEGYEENREYYFAKIEDVLNFLNGEIVLDIYDNRQFQEYYETVTEVYEKNKYELDWEYNKEDDNIWELKS